MRRRGEEESDEEEERDEETRDEKGYCVALPAGLPVDERSAIEVSAVRGLQCQ